MGRLYQPGVEDAGGRDCGAAEEARAMAECARKVRREFIALANHSWAALSASDSTFIPKR